MSNETKLFPDYLFEVSWEVCNKVGGIHTVIATKALTITEKIGGRYILIGPDVHRETDNSEFTEDKSLLPAWKNSLYESGIRVRLGRWNIKGNPIVVLVDFSSFMGEKDSFLKSLWEKYKVDSISGNWDYIEPVLFGYAAAKVIKSYVDTFCLPSDKVAAHFHEWMTASGGLYLKAESPYIANVFTTHATVMGRCIAGNGLHLYNDLETFNADDLARQFGVAAKHSIEKAAAENFDCFATVSDITARECKYLLQKEVDTVTPNGFEDDFVWKGDEFETRRQSARQAMIKVAEAALGLKYDAEPFIVGIGGRYEVKNKGIDVFIDALAKLAQDTTLNKKILGVITIPAGQDGPNHDIQNRLADPSLLNTEFRPHSETHYLSNYEWDPIVRKLKEVGLMDNNRGNVQVLFVPSYLNGNDGIFNKYYYELLAGMDASAFPSYYEPWGYTPLESVAFSVPTITTTLAGFGLWVQEHSPEHKGIVVIDRNDTNDAEVVGHIAETVSQWSKFPAAEYEGYRAGANKISTIALWENLFTYYEKAYDIAINKVNARTNRVTFESTIQHDQAIYQQQHVNLAPAWTRVMVERAIPERLRPLEVLTKNIWWVWNHGAPALFQYIDPALWSQCEHNPITMLDRLSYDRFRQLEADQYFLERLDAVYASFEKYMNDKDKAKAPKIAYFSMEYGLHSSLKIYSGGLGILAGDYLKEASDKNTPIVAVGLLYRYGYFTQKLSAAGNQEASYEPQNFNKLPISPVRDADGNWMTVKVAFPGRDVEARLWRCDVGRTELYLMDTDHELNLPEDRSITYHLYGGDWENRLKQEFLLGVGGVRALKALGKRADVFHCNEGHAAFIGVERIRDYINDNSLSFAEAMEVVRSSSLYTTHTPVPAGHDAFPETMIRQYMSHYPERMGITWEQFIGLGKVNTSDPNERFSMSTLACSLSQEVNGVSWLHGEVSKDILGNLWPGYFKNELHIGYVTNGVHYPTWASAKIKTLYAQAFGAEFDSPEPPISCWQGIYNVEDEVLWDTRLQLKSKLIEVIKKRVSDPAQFRFDSPRQMVTIKESLKPDVLTIGFARRFATYKRANLLFTNLDRLDRIVNNPARPVQFIFAGKAHPNDIPGQDLIKRIVEIAAMPRFTGKIIFLQNYDMELARRMVQGVDVWLNTPTRPLEASGTSGEKAVMNGSLHFSVLDGWWVEGYKEGAGWMLPMERTYDDQNFQNEMDAEMIYNIIEEQIAEAYYARNENNIPSRFVGFIKKSIADVASNFTTTRMLIDYEQKFYGKLYDRSSRMIANNFEMARRIAGWKRNVSHLWNKVNVVSVRQFDVSKQTIMMGVSYNMEVAVNIGGLKPEDVGVEMIVARQITEGSVDVVRTIPMQIVSVQGKLVTYGVKAEPQATGTYDVAIRIYPSNSELPHRMDFPLVKWA